jgi:hypothetical protein
MDFLGFSVRVIRRVKVRVRVRVRVRVFLLYHAYKYYCINMLC